MSALKGLIDYSDLSSVDHSCIYKLTPNSSGYCSSSSNMCCTFTAKHVTFVCSFKNQILDSTIKSGEW